MTLHSHPQDQITHAHLLDLLPQWHRLTREDRQLISSIFFFFKEDHLGPGMVLPVGKLSAEEVEKSGSLGLTGQLVLNLESCRPGRDPGSKQSDGF